MLDEFFILRRDGLSLFHIRLEENSFTVQLPEELFAGFSSAIVAFTSELGAGHLSKIEIEEHVFVYEVMEDLITVAKISMDDDETIAEHIVALLYREFVKEYRVELKNFDGTVRRDIFFPFAEKVRTIVQMCVNIARNNPSLLANIPPSITIEAIEKLSNFSEEMIDKFPESTIRMTRNFQKELPKGEMHFIMYKLGIEVGKDVAKKKIKKKATDKAIMKILNEISVCSLKNNIITMQICPFCRGRETKIFDCDFVSGFIEGAYNNPNICVREIACHAVGAKHCQFQVFKIDET